jgi:hypothetical protein
MSKIFVVEPHRMLQQAIALFLFPAHEVQIVEVVPESLPANDFDALIIDAASLQETKGMAGQPMRVVQDWKVPTVWIESGGSSEITKRDNLVLMHRPIDREALQSALAMCLEHSTALRRNGTAAEDKETASEAAPKSGVIELVDVVEDDASQKTTRAERKKKQ